MTASRAGAMASARALVSGGEVSMGGTAAGDALCDVPGPTGGALPVVHRVAAGGFWIDATELTNEACEEVVNALGGVTIAGRVPTAAEFPGARPENLVAGSDHVFRSTI